MATRPMTEEELRNLPVTTDIPTAGRAYGMTRSHAYELLARDEFPVPVLRVGKRYRVAKRHLLAALGLTETGAAS